jgi:S1-C subfamily serine protease
VEATQSFKDSSKVSSKNFHFVCFPKSTNSDARIIRHTMPYHINLLKLLTGSALGICLTLVQHSVQAQPTSTATSQPSVSTTIGTGFVVANGHVLTALHVVLNNDLILVGPTPEKKWLKADLIKSDLASDLALLTVNIDAPPLVLANWKDVPVGLEVIAIGYPQPRLQGLSKKITQGIINGNRTDRNESINAEYFQYSAETSVGNSGGPLIAPDGLVIGMTQSKLNALGAAQKTNDLAINVSYGLKSSKLIQFLEQSPAAVSTSTLSLQTLLRPYQIFEKTQGSIFAVLVRKAQPATAP